MRNYLNKINKKFSNFGSIFFLLLLVLVSVFGIQIYNYNKEKVNQNYINLINNIYFQKSLSHLFEALKPKYINIDHKILQGETFDEVLNKYQIPKNEIKKIKKILSKKNNINALKINQIIKFTIDQSENKKITSFIFPLSRTNKILLTRNLKTDKFNIKELITNLNKRIIFKEGKILQSLYKTASDLEIKANIIIDFASVYGFQVDFQRDIKKNDRFQIMYEVFETDEKEILETGNIIFANLKLSGQNNPLYFYDKKNNQGHYDLSGRSVKKALMKTPINGARLSSSYGMRKHPIDGFNKMHRGTDFAAPTGTPIMASGNGVVTKAGWCGGGGNCIKIKHNKTYTTVYAHLSSFAKGVKSKVRVKQGQIIGYVGSTGKSTGPHLHYEVIS